MPNPDAGELLALQDALAGEYVIERELGRGGMGIVYLARDVELERLVAIKVLPPEYAVRVELRERFLREARTAGKLSHPNIVPVHRADQIGNIVFFVMAYVDGETLGQRVRGRGPLAGGQAARTLREVAWALAYAHARGVVHRDIKPDNILLERETGRALVTDFGIALRTDVKGLTDEGNVMGTAQFMSPEQASGEQLDGRSDLYALGVVGYFAVTGDVPFEGPTVQSILAKHLTQPPASLGGRSGVPPALAQAIDKCLAKAPTDRWPTGEALADAIGDASPTIPVTPAPIRVWLSKGAWMGPLLIVWYLFWLLEWINRDASALAMFVGAVAPAVLYALVNGALVRRALDAGYGYEDLIAGLRQELEARREERRFDVGREPPLAFKVVRWLAYGVWAVIAAMLLLLPGTAEDLSPQAVIDAYGRQFGGLLLVAFIASVFGLMYPGRRLSDGDWFAALRWHFWHGRLGRWLVRVAGAGGDARTRATTVYRPTEIAIGLAAQDLFDALPRELQQRFSELPRTVRRLEDIGQHIRSQLSKLSAAEAGAAAASIAPDARERLILELRTAQEHGQARMAETIAALEAIRLDLLRLSAGVGDPASLTNAIASARAFGDKVDAVLQADRARARADS
jgi:serine/threonine-protein kinase